MLDHANLPVPQSIVDAATHDRTMFNEPAVERARFFVAA
jgi:hypothetical protein